MVASCLPAHGASGRALLLHSARGSGPLVVGWVLGAAHHYARRPASPAAMVVHMRTPDFWTWGLDDAKVRQWEMQTEPAWDAEDAAEVFDDSPTSWARQELKWVGYNEAYDLQRQLNNDIEVLCYCGCGEMFPENGGDYDSWDFEYGQDHLAWIYRT